MDRSNHRQNGMRKVWFNTPKQSVHSLGCKNGMPKRFTSQLQTAQKERAIMRFGIDGGYGIPFYLNGELMGWVCRTVDAKWMISYPQANPYDFYEENTYNTLAAAKLKILSWFGE